MASLPHNLPGNSGYQRLALDNLLRRELKVSDPHDSKQIAQALLSRYKHDPRANAIAQEAKGLPFLQSAATTVPLAQAPSSSDAELKQALDDVNRDLQALLTNTLLKDVSPELEGWAQAVRSAIQEGSVAARFALDPRQRDKAFAIRRQLGDYARLARFVGALTLPASQMYRKFAQSLDEVAAILLVLMGEALANVGFSGGRFLLQTPYSELQVRRDAVINALRNLTGATQSSFSGDAWPRGLDAYRNLYRVLEVNGQGDLRSLLVENELSRIMDELIQRAAHGNAEGLRAVGATAKLDLQRFRRLITLGQYSVSPESPPLVAFLESLQLFVDAFETGGGSRLLKIARPPILFYGLYGMGGLSQADETLVSLVTLRGSLAEQLDCFLQFADKPEKITCQVLLDKVLYDVDRAIDLYAVGVDEFGEPERRAAAYSFVIESVLTSEWNNKLPDKLSSTDAKSGILNKIQGLLRPVLKTSESYKWFDFLGKWENEENDMNKSIWSNSFPLTEAKSKLDNKDLPVDIIKIAGEIGRHNPNSSSIDMPDSLEMTLHVLRQELCIQQDTEQRWENLVRSMASTCHGFDVFDQIYSVLDNAIKMVGGTCEPFEVNIPPDIATSLDSLVDDVDRMGRGRSRWGAK